MPQAALVHISACAQGAPRGVTQLLGGGHLWGMLPRVSGNVEHLGTLGPGDIGNDPWWLWGMLPRFSGNVVHFGVLGFGDIGNDQCRLAWTLEKWHTRHVDYLTTCNRDREILITREPGHVGSLNILITEIMEFDWPVEQILGEHGAGGGGGDVPTILPISQTPEP